MKALSIIGIIGFSITFLVGCTYLSSYDSGQNAAAAWDTIAGMYGLALSIVALVKSNHA